MGTNGDDAGRVYCNICNRYLGAVSSTLKNHVNTQEHRQAYEDRLEEPNFASNSSGLLCNQSQMNKDYQRHLIPGVETLPILPTNYNSSNSTSQQLSSSGHSMHPVPSSNLMTFNTPDPLRTCNENNEHASSNKPISNFIAPYDLMNAVDQPRLNQNSRQGIQNMPQQNSWLDNAKTPTFSNHSSLINPSQNAQFIMNKNDYPIDSNIKTNHIRFPNLSNQFS